MSVAASLSLIREGNHNAGLDMLVACCLSNPQNKAAAHQMGALTTIRAILEEEIDEETVGKLAQAIKALIFGQPLERAHCADIGFVEAFGSRVKKESPSLELLLEVLVMLVTDEQGKKKAHAFGLQDRLSDLQEIKRAQFLLALLE